MMRRVLHVIPSLRFGSAARQLALLAEGLSGEYQSHVVCLQDAGVELPASVPVESLGWRRALDFAAIGRLRQRIDDFQPDIIHAWRPAALRVVRMVRPRCPIILSRPLTAPNPLARRLDDWLLRGVARVTVTSEVEAKHGRAAGLAESRIAVVRPGVKTRELIPARLQIPGVPATARYIACLGPVEARKGLRIAIWAFDILQYLYNDLHLLVIGTGPEQVRLQKFANDIGTAGKVHFLGDRRDVAEVFAAAELIWVPGRSGGTGAIVEAMAAGRAVVAAQSAEARELLHDGEAGRLVPPDDPALLARQTRLVMDDAVLRRRLGDAGRLRAARDFALADMARDYERVYDQLLTACSAPQPAAARLG
jgi:glycosyltransferase involved in cell wall biosynthesis